MIRRNFIRLLGVDYSKLFLIILFFIATTGAPLIAQKENLKNIITSIDAYGSPYREIAYCHLNKSSFIKGETLGFSGYVLDKDAKVPSKMTKNLYCVITDNQNKVIKSKLVSVNDGFANNIFKIDDLFSSGNYTFKAYTNWMNNFNEPNAFIESFRVLDPTTESTVDKTDTENVLDVQFLPAGGHFVDNVRTVIGVIIKNSKGVGIAEVEGIVYDSNNQRVAAFKTNAMGISKFLLSPELDQNYLVKINHFNKDFKYSISDIRSKGISVKVSNARSQLAIEFNTNEKTLKDIAGKMYNMTIYNGKEIKGLGLTFREKNLIKMVDKKELYSGINIITLFDENNKPILERLYFNYDGMNLFNSGTVNHTKEKDSISISLPFAGLADNTMTNSNISISVLPEKTTSNRRHQNIISQTYLQPYVKGYIENAQYYFTNIDAKKSYDLDNLLITQGWSSYNWETIFNDSISDEYVYEDGIVLKANPNNKRQRDFMVYPLQLNDGMVVKLEEDQQSFVVSNLYPTGDEKLGIGTLNKQGKVRKPNLSLEFFPSKFSDHQYQFKALHPNKSVSEKALSQSQFTSFTSSDAELLDEVVVESNVKLREIQRLSGDAFSNVDVFDDKKRAMNLTFVNYVNYYLPGFIAYEVSGTIEVTRRVSTSLVDSIQRPLIYLDDVLMPGLQFFYGFDMSIVDYVTVNSSGSGEGFLGANGVIRIYTSLDYVNKSKSNSFKQIEFPLTFSEPEKFYVPKYDVYNDDFYREYGVIDWIPNGSIDENGNLKFKVYNPANSSMQLYIEGVTDKGDFVSEQIVIKLNE